MSVGTFFLWCLSSKAPPVKPPNLQEALIAQVVAALKSPEHWTGYQAKRALTQRDPVPLAKALAKWVRSLDPKLSELGTIK